MPLDVFPFTADPFNTRSLRRQRKSEFYPTIHKSITNDPMLTLDSLLQPPINAASNALPYTVIGLTVD